jgi:hypothetical protein
MLETQQRPILTFLSYGSKHGLGYTAVGKVVDECTHEREALCGEHEVVNRSTCE